MVNDIDWIIDDLLARWHRHSEGYRLAKGFSSSDSTCREARSNWSPYDRDNGVPEAELERSTVESVGRAIYRIPDAPRPWRHMIHIEARNLAVGVAVYSSPRLPQNRDEREVLRIEARNKLAKELMEEGCVGN